MTGDICPDCGEPLRPEDGTRTDALGQTIHHNCELSRWWHAGQIGPKPGTRAHDLEQRSKRQITPSSKKADPNLGHIQRVVVRDEYGDLVRIDPQTAADVKRTVRNGQEAPQPYDENSRTRERRRW